MKLLPETIFCFFQNKSVILIMYGFLFELWVLNLYDENNNSAHHSPLLLMGRTLVINYHKVQYNWDGQIMHVHSKILIHFQHCRMIAKVNVCVVPLCAVTHTPSVFCLFSF